MLCKKVTSQKINNQCQVAICAPACPSVSRPAGPVLGGSPWGSDWAQGAHDPAGCQRGGVGAGAASAHRVVHPWDAWSTVRDTMLVLCCVEGCGMDTSICMYWCNQCCWDIGTGWVLDLVPPAYVPVCVCLPMALAHLRHLGAVGAAADAAAVANRTALLDVIVRVLGVLALDRFADFVGDQARCRRI